MMLLLIIIFQLPLISYNFSSATDCSCSATFSNESHFVENSHKNRVSITDIAAILVKLTWSWKMCSLVAVSNT